MAGSDGTPILAIVAKAPRAGDVKTWLCPPLSHAAAAALSAAVLGDTVDLVRECNGARGAFVFTPADREAYFAERTPELLRVVPPGSDLGARLLPPWFDVDTAADLERLDATLAEPGVRAPRTSALRRARQRANA